MSALLSLLQPPEPPEGLRESLRLMDVPELWIVVLVLLPLAALVCWAGYFRESITAGWRLALASLRFGAILLLLLVLFRPVIVQRLEEVRPAEVIVLVDDSASMRRIDSYRGDVAARAALASLAAGSPEDTSRLDLARAALERELLPRLAAEGYEARLFAFSDAVVPLSEPAALAGRGSATHVGDALQQALASHRGRHVTDVVLLSDGRSNGGAPAAEAARTAAGAGVPVHTIVIGDTRPERNVVLELVESPPNALEGDEVAVIVRVVGRGVQERASTPVILEELTGDEDGPGRVVAESEVRLSEAGERILLVAPPGSPDARSSERRFRVTTPPLPDETLLDDNALELSVHVTPEKVRVLYVEGYPRWDYRQLALNILKRSDANIEFQAFLLSATPDFIQESSANLPPLREVPTDRQSLLENYDVIVLGDVNPYAVSSDPVRCDEFLASVYEFVERGGGLLFQAGDYDNPRAYLGTPLEDLLPVELDSGSLLGFSGDTSREVRPILEDPLNPHEIVRLHSDLDVNRRLWEDEGGLRGFYWYYPVSRAKAASQVLLRHPLDGNNYGRHPLLVAGYFPSGRTLFLGLDATWRWRFRYENRYLERFWRNAIRWLALGRLKSGDGRFRLETPRTSYDLGERVVLEARVLDTDFRPSDAPYQRVKVQDTEGSIEELDLQAVDGRPGNFRGTLEAERPGLVRTWIEEGDQRIATAEFEIVLPSRENADPSPDPALLLEIAVASGGTHTDLANLEPLAAEFPGGEERREPISTQLEDVWDSWTTLLVALGLLSAEWILRKRVELV